MSIDATRFVWSLSKSVVSPIEKLILLAIADRCGERGECWPSIARIMQDTLLSRDVIIRHRKRFIEIGILRLTGEMKGRSNQIPVMQLMVDDWREGEYIEDEIDQSFPATGGAERLVPVAVQDGYPSFSKTRNLKEEPKKESTTSSTNFFEDYKEKENENLYKVNAEFTKQQLAEKFRRESLNDPECINVFKERFHGLNVTLEKLYEECVDYWSQTDQQVYKARFLTHLKKTPIDKYKDFKSIKCKTSITPDDKQLIQTYCSLCKAYQKPTSDMEHKIILLRQALKVTDTAEAREAIAAIAKAEEIMQSASFKSIVSESTQRKSLSAVAKNSLSTLKDVLK